MQILKKITPYSMRGILPALGIAAGAMVMGACSKDDDYAPTDPDKTETVKKDTAKFVWGPTIISKEMWPSVEAASKNPNVGLIIIESDGQDYGASMNTSEILGYTVTNLVQRAGDKPVKHQGTINGAFMGTGNMNDERYIKFREDSTSLANLGYVFSKVYYNKNY